MARARRGDSRKAKTKSPRSARARDTKRAAVGAEATPARGGRAKKVAQPKRPPTAKKARATTKVAKKAARKKASPRNAKRAPSGAPSTKPEGAHVIPETVVRRGEALERLPMMELHWGDPVTQQAKMEGLVQRWVRRGEALLRKLAENGASDHEYRADLREGRFVWLAPDGKVSAEANATVLCSWSRSTGVVGMGWADPILKASAVARIDGMPAERDNVNEEDAWRIAMEAAEAAGAEYLYRVPTPHAWYFLALGKITFDPERTSFTPSTPVGLVLKTLSETRQAIESRAEPTDVLRHRIEGVGSALLQEASYTYRDSDWVARLERTGKTLISLATRLPRPTFSSVAAGRDIVDWLDRDAIVDLAQAISLLEDEWSLFA